MGIITTVIIIIAVITLLAFIIEFLRRRRMAKQNPGGIVRSVSTVQSAYYPPVSTTTNYPSAYPNTTSSTQPGWQVSDQPVSGVSITQHGAFVIPREPITYAPNTYPPYPTNHQQPIYNQPPPPYTPGFKYPTENRQ